MKNSYTVLVTGGLGFIGSHTCITLIENGYDVIVIDSLVNSYESVSTKIKEIVNKLKFNSDQKITFKKGDLKNIDWLSQVFQECINRKRPIKSVIHLAGLKSVENSMKDPINYWQTNITVTLNLLSVMNKFSCNNFVFSSSATVYKPLKNRKVTEKTKLEPHTPYGRTKMIIESFLSDLQRSDPLKWRIIILRYFNPVGTHSSGLIGDDPKLGADNIFPALMKVVNKEDMQFMIFGNDWATKDGTCVRDYIHIIDVANAHLASLNYLIRNKAQLITLNIGTGKGISVLELVKTFARINNVEINYSFHERRNGDIPFLVADNSKALDLLDWRPKYNFERMCLDSYKWMKNF